MITPEMTFKEVIERYPIAKDFFAHYGVLRYARRHLMNEPLSSCAKAFSVSPDLFVEELHRFLKANESYRPRKNPIKAFEAVWFSLVMSTGIISMGSIFVSDLYQRKAFSDTLLGFGHALLWINVAAYPTMVIMKLIRCAVYWKEVVADISNPRTSLVFFTIVAGTNIMGAQLSLFGYYEIAKILWYWGLFLWFLITISSFGFLFLGNKAPIEETMQGGWLLATVGTESVAVLGATIAPHYQRYGDFVILLSYVWWFVGGFLYIIIATLLMYRLIFFKLNPQELVPTYWINMGALATTTLAGAVLTLNAMSSFSYLQRELFPFTRGLTFFFWAFCSWWIPMLLLLKLWKYVFQKTKPAFNPEYWAMVYPMGMYTACTYRLSQALDFHSLLYIPKYFWFVAITAWVGTFIGTWVFILKPRNPRYPTPSRLKLLSLPTNPKNMSPGN